MKLDLTSCYTHAHTHTPHINQMHLKQKFEGKGQNYRAFKRE